MVEQALKSMKVGKVALGSSGVTRAKRYHTSLWEAAEIGPSILRIELKCPTEKLKTGKAAGPDDVYYEILKALDEEGQSELIWGIISKIPEAEKFPKDKLKSIFIDLPKIPGTLALYHIFSKFS